MSLIVYTNWKENKNKHFIEVALPGGGSTLEVQTSRLDSRNTLVTFYGHKKVNEIAGVKLLTERQSGYFTRSYVFERPADVARRENHGRRHGVSMHTIPKNKEGFFGEDFAPQTFTPLELPPSNWVVTPTAHIITVEIPGYNSEEYHVTTSGRILTIKGKKAEENKRGIRWLLREPRRRFDREFHLPENVNMEGINTNLSEGIVTITIPKIIEVPAG